MNIFKQGIGQTWRKKNIYTFEVCIFISRSNYINLTITYNDTNKNFCNMGFGVFTFCVALSYFIFFHKMMEQSFFSPKLQGAVIFTPKSEGAFIFS